MDLWKRGLNFTDTAIDSDVRCSVDKNGLKTMLLARIVKSKKEKASHEFEKVGKDMMIIYA